MALYIETSVAVFRFGASFRGTECAEEAWRSQNAAFCPDRTVQQSAARGALDARVTAFGFLSLIKKHRLYNLFFTENPSLPRACSKRALGLNPALSPRARAEKNLHPNALISLDG
jgi:hypothetical protein